MKAVFAVLLLTCAMSFSLQSQVVFDDFSDGDFTSGPEWTGDGSDFVVNDDEQLQLNTSDVGQSYLRTSFSTVSLDDKEWRFYVRQSFSGSGNNYGRVYLAFNGTDLSHANEDEANVSGYYLLFGEPGSDDAVKLFYTDGTSPTLLAQGTAGEVSSSFEWRLQVRRDAAGNWELYADQNAGEAFEQIASGSFSDNDSYENLGWVCTYTSSNADNFYLDDVYFGDWIVDTEPPTVLNAEIVNDTEITVSYSEAMDVSAEVEANYSLSTLGNPLAAFFDGNTSTVTIDYDGNIPTNTELILSINGPTDLEGNPLAPTQLPLELVVLSPIEADEIIISEIMADPTPEVGLPNAEWLELRNNRDEALNLADIVFVNTTSEFDLPQLTLEPDQYVVLCSTENEALLNAFGTVVGLSSFSALANSGDSLTLKRSDEVVIDVVVYTDSWYQDNAKSEGGWSLERINPDHPCSDMNNWRASEDVSGGTPGQTNSIEDLTPDEQAPSVDQAFVLDESTIVIHFSEALDEGSLGNYTLDGELQANLSLVEDVVTISLDTPLELGIVYTINVSGAADCWGNEQNGAFEATLLLGAEPAPGDLIINEIMADPTPSNGLPDGEYVEVYNTSDQYLDLAQILLQESGPELAFVLEPGGYATLISDEAEGEFLFVTNTVVIPGLSSTSLTNGGIEVVLSNAAGEVLDVVEYDLSWYQDADKVEGGWSLERIRIDIPCSDQNNWAASVATLGGTPSAENSLFDASPDLVPPLLLSAVPLADDLLQLTFDKTVQNEGSEITVQIDPEIGVQGVTLDGFSGLVELDQALSEGVTYTLTISGVADCSGNLSVSTSVLVGLAQDAEEGDVVINEILSDPTTGCVDYIEILNRGSRIIDLKDWIIANGSAGIPDDMDPIAEESLLLFPGQHMALCEEALIVEDCYPSAEERIIESIANLPSYNNEDGEVLLLLPDETIMDAVSYSSDWHFRLLDSTDGIALERISPDGDSQQEGNWHSAAENVGWGTPGYLNSQTVTLGVTDDQIEVTQEIFSPDSDGYQDVMLLTYTLDQPGYVANVEVFDQVGRPVKQIAQNELLGTSGVWQWDGSRDEGDRADVGAYLIYIELFDLEGRTELFKRTCVLATRL